MKATSGIAVDYEFKMMIPVLRDEERQQLEANIVEHGGARDPLVVWRDGDRDVLIDGHNRYEICERLGLEYRVEPMAFASRDEAADWIDRNQLGRRNLSRQDYALVLGRRYNRTKKANDGSRGNQHTEAAGKVTAGNTAERLAKEHGVTEKTVRNAGKFQAAAATLGIERAIAAGKVKATEAAVVKAAAALPAKPSRKQVAQAREEAVAPKPRGSKAKSNASAARKIDLLLSQLRAKVELLDENAPSKSERRKYVAAELRRLAGVIERAN
jgi:hypothetical protein